jgi:SAM-dependent methyltransferase
MSTSYDQNQYSQFWNNHHLNNDNFWLTGSDLSEIKYRHHIDDEMLLNKDVLEIGVGLGKMTHELSKVAKNIYASDISEVGLDRIKAIAKKTVLSKDIATLPPVDIAICHLVFQHCSDEEIQRIINDVNLKEDGIFYFQFAEYPNPISSMVNEFIAQKNHFFRSLEQIKNIVKNTNKELIFVSPP